MMFARVPERLRSPGLPRAKILGVDATTLEATAALRSIVRCEEWPGYEA